MAASEVCFPRITSRTGTMWAGWKKWDPPMRSGRAMRSPTWVMGRPEVLLASTVSGGAAASMRRKSSCLASRFSVIDSTTNSAEPTASSRSVVARRRPATASAVSPFSRSCRCRSSAPLRMFSRPRSRVSCRRLMSTVSRLPRASTRAIWLPMRPPPTTADFSEEEIG